MAQFEPFRRACDDRAAGRRAAPVDRASPSTANRVRVPEGSTVLDACRSAGVRHPDAVLRRHADPEERLPGLHGGGRGRRACWCPSCSRPVEAGMVVHTDTERTRHSPGAWCSSCSARRVDLSIAPERRRWMDRVRRATRPASAERGHGRAAGQGRQRPLRPGLRQVHPLLQVRRRVRRAVAEHVRHRASPGEGSTPASRPSATSRCPTRPASTAATASRCARPGR